MVIICLQLSVDTRLRIDMFITENDWVIVVVQDGDECSSVLVIRDTASIVNVAGCVPQYLLERFMDYRKFAILQCL